MLGVACVFALMWLGSAARANTLCERLDQVHADALILPQGDAVCRTSLAMDGMRNMHCALEFEYRSADARAAFDGLVAEMAACLGPDATMSGDQAVNHPDAFELIEFDLNGRSYAVSIKDKGALQQTLVFVRVQIL